MASLKDVAQKAGVSTATVSRVINNHTSVSWDVRRRVHAAMNDLSYLPNKSSISLEGKRSGLLGCIIPNLTNPHFSELIMTLEREARFYGMDLIVKTHLNQPEQESAALNSFIALGIEGLFWVPTENEITMADIVKRSGIATAIVTQRSKFFSSFLVDYGNGMLQAAAHIKQSGWHYAGFVGQQTVDMEKYSVFKSAFDELAGTCHLDPDAVFWLEKGLGETLASSIGNQEQLHQSALLSSLKPRPTLTSQREPELNLQQASQPTLLKNLQQQLPALVPDSTANQMVKSNLPASNPVSDLASNPVTLFSHTPADCKMANPELATVRTLDDSTLNSTLSGTKTGSLDATLDSTQYSTQSNTLDSTHYINQSSTLNSTQSNALSNTQANAQQADFTRTLPQNGLVELALYGLKSKTKPRRKTLESLDPKELVKPSNTATTTPAQNSLKLLNTTHQGDFGVIKNNQADLQVSINSAEQARSCYQPKSQEQSLALKFRQSMQAIVTRLCQRKAKNAEPLVLWVYNDVCALALEQECLKAGLKIPEDVGIISCDNTYIAQILNLSSISQPINQIARLAYQHVAEEHHRKQASRTVRLNSRQEANDDREIECVEIPPQLFIRSSSCYEPQA